MKGLLSRQRNMLNTLRGRSTTLVRDRSGTDSFHANCPEIVFYHNRYIYIGSLDLSDQLRSYFNVATFFFYHLEMLWFQQWNKLWNNILWVVFELAFINSFISWKYSLICTRSNCTHLIMHFLLGKYLIRNTSLRKRAGMPPKIQESRSK